ncbi:peroxidase 7-like [Nicotiana tabacum]|uniref:Peroxidase n=1 Tax=Nicotiana tabacum TaxID=4097 RepID=A0A1S3Z4M5_TOBAC|nr:peroxidase 7 [Nicotiana tomentosiformis]XP_016459304.1 PREDICTED: peroxidase 7-like [Nicotiana tabacum]
MKSFSSTATLLYATAFFLVAFVSALPFDDIDLPFDYYSLSCPKLEEIVHNKMEEWVKKDYTLAPALMRLHFHDCVVRGCDASILLDHEGSEKSAKASKTLRGFEVIEDIKREVERVCPRTVSCADILTVAARDATLAVGGPFWMVPYGRKDGTVSYAKEADQLVPTGHEVVTDLLELFQSKGLNVLDLVVLSGAHTIGRTTCESLQYRLYNYNGTRKSDSRLDHLYLNYLERKCRWASEYVDLDAVTPKKFDVQYYKNLQKGMGLLLTDQLLYSDPRTAPIVTALATQPDVFENLFAASMVKLGNIQDYLSVDGEVRLSCASVNSPGY